MVEPAAGQVPTAPSTADPSRRNGPASTDPSATVSTAAALPSPSPSQPASITRAPAPGAPSNAAVRAAVARLQRAVARYHLDRVNVSGALVDQSQLPPGRYNVSIASFYDLYGSGVACGGVLHPWTLGVANKTLPCGTEVIFRYGDRAIRIPVIDRGPYIAGREWDLTGAAAEALHFPGLGPIQWRLSP